MALRQIMLERHQILTERVAPNTLLFSVVTWHKFNVAVPVTREKTFNYFIDAALWVANDRKFDNEDRRKEFVNILEELYISGMDYI